MTRLTRGSPNGNRNKSASRNTASPPHADPPTFAATNMGISASAISKHTANFRGSNAGGHGMNSVE